jgi:restriction system protein
MTEDDKDHTLPEAKDRLADEMGLSPEDRGELVSSGRKTRLQDRVAWAKTYIQAAGLIEAPARARFRITTEGHRLLAGNPPRIDANLLRRYESFRQFLNRAATTNGAEAIPVVTADNSQQPNAPTPSDAMEAAYRQHRAGLAEEVLAQVKTMSPAFFENTVVQLMVRLGYGGAEGRGTHIGRTGDGGVDGVISEDKLGLDVVYVQAKRWDGPVGRPFVQAFVGSLEGFRARKGVMMTTSQFTADARTYVENIEKRVVLIDGPTLAALMIDTGLGVTPERTYVVSAVDSDFFSEG